MLAHVRYEARRIARGDQPKVLAMPRTFHSVLGATGRMVAIHLKNEKSNYSKFGIENTTKHPRWQCFSGLAVGTSSLRVWSALSQSLRYRNETGY